MYSLFTDIQSGFKNKIFVYLENYKFQNTVKTLTFDSEFRRVRKIIKSTSQLDGVHKLNQEEAKTSCCKFRRTLSNSATNEKNHLCLMAVIKIIRDNFNGSPKPTVAIFQIGNDGNLQGLHLHNLYCNIFRQPHIRNILVIRQKSEQITVRDELWPQNIR